MTLSLDSLLWKLWLAGMAVLVLLSGAGMQRVSTEGGICLTHIFILEGKKKSVIYFPSLQPAHNFQFTLIAVGRATLNAIYFGY